MHPQPQKDQGKLDICCQVQWETQGKTCGRWFCHSRPCREHLLRRSDLRLVIFLGELNNLELWGADIGIAFLEAYTHEKLFIIAGAEFEELEGFILVFNKALYGLKSSGRRWAERFHNIIKDMGFMSSKADPCVWMRENKDLKCYEYKATHVDDLCIAAQDPGQIIQIFKEDYKLKVKGDGPLSHHLGADYTRDKDKTLVCQSKKYIDRLLESYQSMFKHNPPKNM